MMEATGSSAAMPGRTRLRAARNGRKSAASSSVRSRTASISAWATGRSDPPLSMARPISTTNPRRRASAAHSVTRRVLPIPASPVRTANPPVPTSARPNISTSSANSRSRPTILMGGVSQTTTALDTACGAVPALGSSRILSSARLPEDVAQKTLVPPTRGERHEHIPRA
jgi:hypothetical protein